MHDKARVTAGFARSEAGARSADAGGRPTLVEAGNSAVLIGAPM